ncbi:MAG: LysR family transcriptional regulator [Pseudomonadales bacterium]|nr:LysR family transcriptional regulator [Pseudomonadales bacterium]
MARLGFIGQLSDIDLRMLKVFLSVAENGGFAAAEQELNINRSTISIHISDLETRIGMQLCQRGRGRSTFSLTPQGEALYQSTKEFLQYLETFRNQINAIQSNMTGNLQIALPDDWLEMSSASFDLAPIIAQFRERAPRVTLEVVTRAPHELDFDLLNGKAHLGVNTVHIKRPGLVYTPIFKHQSHLYCSLNHPLFKIPSEQLDAETIVEYDLVASGHKVQAETNSLISLFQNRANADHMEGCLLLISSGKYIGFLPDYYAHSRADKYHLRQLLPTSFSYHAENALIYKKSTLNNTVANLFIQYLNEAIHRPIDPPK